MEPIINIDDFYPVITDREKDDNTPEVITPKAILAKIKEAIEKQERKNTQVEGVELTGIKCSTCGLDIVVENYYDHRFADLHFIGPNTPNMSLKYYCRGCGISYEGKIIRNKIQKQKSG